MNQHIEIEYKLDNQYIKAICYNSKNQKQRDSLMKLQSIYIENVGGISNLTLDNLDPHLNIICGENGVGKTNILESIAHCFSTLSENILKRKYNSNQGVIRIKPYDDKFVEFNVDNFFPRDYESNSYAFDKYISNFLKNNQDSLIYFKTERMFSYTWLDTIKIYETKTEHLKNLDGVPKEALKDWFIRNELLSSKEYASPNDLSSGDWAKQAFNILNKNYTFSALRKDMEIYVNTPTGEIPYEYLSSGFKTCIFIIWGIIREIQIRFPQIHVSYFEGTILIDEIELHLHPEWQGKICNVLKDMFPSAQFIMTTHSPHVVQSAEVNQVIALGGENGYLEKRTIDIAPNGFKGWTIEEILTDVMGMKDTRTEWFRERQKQLEKSLDEDNFEEAKKVFDELKSKLHPNSTDLALFRFQLDMLEGRTK